MMNFVRHTYFLYRFILRNFIFKIVIKETLSDKQKEGHKILNNITEEVFYS